MGRCVAAEKDQIEVSHSAACLVSSLPPFFLAVLPLESGFNLRHIFIAHIYAYSYTFEHRLRTLNGSAEPRRGVGCLCAGARTGDR